ncbi:MAG: glycerophosphodiester phosphodiesterase, partial [Verrucomicrobiota bacterium]
PFAQTPLPTMDEFLGKFAGKIGFYFDAKAISPAALAEALERHKVVDRTVVYQSAQYLTQLKAINPQIRGLAPLGKPEDFAELASKLKPYGVDADWDILSKDLIARCHAAGVKVFSDSLGDHERIEDYLQAIEWGIDVISTDHPLRLLRAIELWMNGRK